MEWSNNNTAHVNTWYCLRVLNQHKKSFSQACNLKSNQLTFWNEAADGEARDLAASTICHQLDNMFRLLLYAKFENDSNVKKAVESMKMTLLKESSTIQVLAVVVDKNYKFLKEPGYEKLF